MKNSLLFLFSTVLGALASAQLPQISLTQVANGYASPTDIKSCGDQRLFVVEQKGYIRILYKDGTKQTTPFLNIDARVNNSQDEQGLLGLAFSPNYKQDGYFYVQYTTGPGVDSIRISRFSVLANDSTQADPASEQVLLSFKDLEWNHNGGNLMFGPDGYLYISEGDGGSANDPDGSHGTGGTGQNKNSLFGKILRLDVSNPAINYAIPPSNPFVGVPNTRPEIWAYGLRNAWRCSFDKLTGDMWIGDVGQNTYEEIDFQDASSAGGENYGWRCREGFHLCPSSNTTGCGSVGYVDPVAEIVHGPACSITGGYVYRGVQYSKLFGLYLFTDYCSGQFWSIRRTGANSFDVDTLVVSPTLTYNLSSFGQDDLGELYVAWRGSSSGSTGRIYRVAESTDCHPVAFITAKDTLEGCKPMRIAALQGDTLSYQWYDANGLISGATSPEYEVPQTGWYKVMVTKTLHAGCETMSDSVYVGAYDTVALSAPSAPLQYCINASSIHLASQVSPLGGIFSGNGVIGDSILPSAVGLGTTTISYQVISNFGCESMIQFPVQMLDTIPLFAVTDLTYCAEATSVSLTGAVQPIGGVFISPFVSNDSLFNPNAAGIGTTTIGYEFIDTGSAACVSHKTIEANVALCVGIQETDKGISFQIFPNPSQGIFNLKVKVNLMQQAEVMIADVVGKICYRKTLLLDPNKPLIPLQLNLAKGVYTLQLKGEEGTATRNLVIE